MPGTATVTCIFPLGAAGTGTSGAPRCKVKHRQLCWQGRSTLRFWSMTASPGSSATSGLSQNWRLDQATEATSRPLESLRKDYLASANMFAAKACPLFATTILTLSCAQHRDSRRGSAVRGSCIRHCQALMVSSWCVAGGGWMLQAARQLALKGSPV